MKKKYQIDAETLIIQGKIQQIRHSNEVEFALIKVWIVDISPQESQKYIALILQLNDTTDLSHLKRFCKQGTHLKCLVGSESCTHDFKDAYLIDVPLFPPQTKQQALEQSKLYWPVIWRGDPNIQNLNQLELDFDFIDAEVRRIVSIAELSAGLPIVTSIYDPVRKQILATETDERYKSPLRHSVINCIEAILKLHKSQGQQNYLCLGYWVFTTHEPCSYCSMALNHSRIAQLYYLKDQESTGAIALNYQLHDLKQLNWKFYAFKYLEATQALTVTRNLYV